MAHVLDEGRSEEHELREMARVRDDGRVVYPPPEDDQAELFDEGGAESPEPEEDAEKESGKGSGGG